MTLPPKRHCAVLVRWGLISRCIKVARNAAPLMLLATSGCERPVETATYEVLLTLPHDTTAYTQGLLFHDRLLWESTGGWGTSELRLVDPQTGRAIQSRAVPDSLFGEGLALADSVLIQLTWKAGRAFVYDLDSLSIRHTFRYDGEGWGLCYDGAHLFMSNGSDSLYRRDPETFAQLGEAVQVTSAGRPVHRLNELECVGDYIWANVFREDRIVQIARATGRVVREVSGVHLRPASGVPNDGNAVLNGIAYAANADVFFITGKLWPKMYVVRVVEDG